MKVPQFCTKSWTMFAEIVHKQKRATWQFRSQDEANISRQDDPPKVGFPIGLERFLPFNLSSFFDRFVKRFIFVKMPKLMRKVGADPAGCRRSARTLSALRKKMSEGYIAKEK